MFSVTWKDSDGVTHEDYFTDKSDSMRFEMDLINEGYSVVPSSPFLYTPDTLLLNALRKRGWIQ